MFKQWEPWGIRLLFAFYLGFSTLGFLRLPGAINQSFGGFIWLRDDIQGLSVSWEVGKGWIGRQAGLALDDRILRIQGQEIPLSGDPDVIDKVYRQATIGQLIDYEVERQGEDETLHIQVPVTRFTWRHLFESYIPFYAAGLIVWGIGLFMYTVSSKEPSGSVFSLLCLALSATLFSHSFNGFIYKFYKPHWLVFVIYGLTWPMLNAFAVHLFSIVPKPRAWWPLIRSWVYGIAIAIGVVHSYSFIPWGDSRLMAPTLLTMTVYSIIASLYGIIAFVSAYRRGSSPWERQQIKIIGLGLGLGVLIPVLPMSAYILFRPYPGIWWSPSELLGIRLVSDWWLPVPFQVLMAATIFPIFTAMAVLRYGAFNAKPAVVKTTTTATLVFLLVIAYTLFVNALQALFSYLSLDALVFQLVGENFDWMWVSNILATLVTAVIFAPLRDYIHRWLTRLLYPYRITVDEALKQLIEAVRYADRTLDTAAETNIPQILTRTLKDVLYLQDVFLWFYFPATGELQLTGHRNVQPARLPLDKSTLQYLTQARPPIELPTNPALKSLSIALADLNVQMCLPLVYREHELVGLVGLGSHQDEVPFSPEDQQLFFHLTEYLLLLLNNVRAIRSLQQSRERISMVQEMERRRIAQELHDETLQSLSYLATVKLELCKRAVPNPPQAIQLIQDVQQEIGQTTAYLRDRLADISPDIISRRGLVSALESLVDNVHNRWSDQKIEITLHISGYTNQMLPEYYELGVFRCVQQALSNALKHAQASKIDVRLQCADCNLVVTVQDDGRGFNVDQLGEVLYQGHLGVQNMRDRIEALRGEFSIKSAPGTGTTVRAKIPMPTDE